MCHWAVCISSRKQNLFIRIQHLCAFPHEHDTAEYNNISIDFRRHITQIVGIPDVVRDILNLILHIIMRHDHSILCRFQLLNSQLLLFHTSLHIFYLIYTRLFQSFYLYGVYHVSLHATRHLPSISAHSTTDIRQQHSSSPQTPRTPHLSFRENRTAPPARCHCAPQGCRSCPKP